MAKTLTPPHGDKWRGHDPLACSVIFAMFASLAFGLFAVLRMIAANI